MYAILQLWWLDPISPYINREEFVLRAVLDKCVSPINLRNRRRECTLQGH